jgi:hypothetical protein
MSIEKCKAKILNSERIQNILLKIIKKLNNLYKINFKFLFSMDIKRINTNL